LSEFRVAHKQLSAEALKEHERFSEELTAINERCLEVRVGLALFTLFSPELGLWVGTFRVIFQSKHQLR
jgi:hypothetical protein